MSPALNCPDCGEPSGEDQLCYQCLVLGMSLGEPTSSEDDFPEIEGYQILQEIGRGGMGIVFRAQQTELKREVALKLVLDGRLAGKEAKQRFLREAEYAARLDHPAIVPTYDSGENQGFYYLSTRLMTGGSLAEHRPDPGTKNAREIARLVIRLAEALSHGHQRGIIHRDVKPANILLDEQGNVYLSDFGLAHQPENSPRLTATGRLSGSPGYIAPEQLGQGELSVAVDVYSLGVVLFELLTGELPFEQDSLPKLFQDISQKEARFPEHSRDLDASLQAICLKCLRKDPSDRYLSARLLAEDLQRFLERRPVLAKPVSSFTRAHYWVRRHPSLALLLCALFLSGTIALEFFLHNVGLQKELLAQSLQEEQSKRHRLASELTAQGEELCRNGSVEQGLTKLREAAALSHDDQASSQSIARLLAAWDSSARFSYRHPGSERVQLAASPIRNQFASWNGGKICCLWQITTPEKKKPRILHLDEAISDVAFSPDGKTLAVCSQSRLAIYDLDSLSLQREILREIPIDEPSNTLLQHRVAFSPDGQTFVAAFAYTPPRFFRTADYSLIAQVPLPPLTDQRGNVTKIHFTSQSIVIGYLGGLLIYDQKTNQSKHLSATQRMEDFTIDSREKLLAIAEHNKMVQLFSWESLELLDEGEHLSRVTSVSFSDDASLLLSASRDRVSKVWKVDSKRQLHLEATQLEEGAVTHCQWIPGTKQFLTASEDGFLRYYQPPYRHEIHRIRLDGSPAHSLVATPKGYLAGTNWGAIYSISPPEPTPKTTSLKSEARLVRQDGDELVFLADWGEGLRGLERRRDTQLVAELKLEPKPRPHSMNLSYNGRLAVAGTDEGVVKIWETVGMKLIFEKKLTDEIILHTAISGNRVAILTRAKELLLYQYQDQKWLGRQTSTEHISAMTFSPDGTHLALGFTNGYLQLVDAFNLESRPFFPSAPAHRNHIRTLEFDPSGSLLASAGFDRCVCLHRVHDGSPISPPIPHEDYVWSLAFSPDGRTLATAGQELRMRFFEPHTGYQLGPAQTQSSWLNTLVFRDDYLLGVGRDWSLREIPLPKKPTRD